MPKTLVVYEAQEVADHLTKQGHKVVEVTDWEDMVDGMVDLDNRFHVQVGEGYLSLGEELEENGMTVYQDHGIIHTLEELDKVMREVM